MIGYSITGIFLMIAYPLGIWAFRYIKRPKLFTALLAVFCGMLHVHSMVSFGSRLGLEDWNFMNTLPTANMSPFIFCMTPFLVVFPKKIRKYFLGAVSLLSLALFCAGIFTCISNIMRDYSFHLVIAFDAIAHCGVSLLGIYYVKSKQTDLRIKTCLISGLILIGVAFTMLLLNIFLHTSFFGLSVYGEHNIYNVVVSDSGLVSAGLYFIGLSIALVGGWIFQRIINKKGIEQDKD